MDPEYSKIQTVLENSQAAVGAAELHGLYCGLLCVQPAAKLETCLPLLYPDHAAGRDEAAADACMEWLAGTGTAEQLIGLLDWSREKINDANLGFALLLPNDEASLVSRAGALKSWCEGFLYGIGLAGVTLQQSQGEVQEFLQDIAHLTRLDHESMEPSEENEQDLFELMEFVRIGVLYLQEELCPVPGSRVVH